MSRTVLVAAWAASIVVVVLFVVQPIVEQRAKREDVVPTGTITPSPTGSESESPSLTPLRSMGVPTPSRSPIPSSGCITVPRGFGPEERISKGFLLVLYSASRKKGATFQGRLWGEFARLVIRLREFHPNIPIALVVDDLVESWVNGARGVGTQPMNCFAGYDIYSLIDYVINAERDPRTAAIWTRGQKFMAATHERSAGSDFVLHSVAWHLTPFDRTIFMDADVMPCGSIEGLFELLGRFDAAAVPDIYRGGGMRMPEFLNLFIDSMNIINMGMFVYDYRRPGVKCWINETFNVHLAGLPPEPGQTLKRVYATDQEPFMGALWQCKDANIWMLQDEWVCFHQTSCSAKADIGGRRNCKVVHSHGLYATEEFKLKDWREAPRW